MPSDLGWVDLPQFPARDRATSAARVPRG